MSKKPQGNAALNVGNKALNEAMETYAKDSSKENLLVLMQEARKGRYLIPARFSRKLNDLELQRLKMGKPLPPDQQPGMVPILVKNQKDDQFAPAFTSQEALLAAPEAYPVVINVDFDEVMRIASQDPTKVKGIILNPFTNRLVLHPEFINAIRRMKEGEASGKTNGVQQEVKMTLPEFQAATRRNIEFGILPNLLFGEPEKFTGMLEEQENFLFDLYRKPFGDHIPCSYEKTDFDVMSLNIREDASVISIDLPEPDQPGMARSIYVVHNPQTDKYRYFVVEYRPEGERFIELTEDKKVQDHGEAPPPGSALSALLEIL